MKLTVFRFHLSVFTYKKDTLKGCPFCKSGDDLLSHKRNEVKFVGAGSIRSHAAWTEFMPVRVAKRRHHQERRALIPVYAKRRVLLELVFS